MSNLTTLFSRVNAAVPGLKYLGFGMWNAWAYVGMRGFLWNGNDMAVGLEDPLFRYISEFAKIAIVLILLLVNKEFLNRLINSTAFILGVGVLSSVGAGLILVPSVAQQGSVLITAASAVLSASSIILLLKSAQLFATLRPQELMVRLIQSALAVLFVYFILRSAPHVYAIVLYALLFLISAALLCLYNVEKIASKDALGSFLEVRTIPNVNRLFFSLTLVMFACSVAATIYERSVPVGELDALYSHTSFLAVTGLALGFLAISAGLPKTPFHKMFHPLVAVFAAIVSVPMLLNVTGAVGVAVSEFYLILIIMFLPGVWAYLSHQSKSSPVAVFGLGYIWSSCGSSLGWFVGGALSSIAAQGVLAKPILAVAMVLIFMATLLFVLPKEMLPSIFVPIDEPAPSEPEPVIENTRTASIDGVATRFGLTQRESEVLNLIALGLDNEAISERMVVSYYTVRAHVRNIYSKTSVHSREELMALIIGAGAKG